MHFSTAVAFIVALFSPLLLECSSTRPKEDKHVCVNQDCPVRVISAPSQESGVMDFKRVNVSLCVKKQGSCETPEIKMSSPFPKKWPHYRKNKKQKTHIKKRCESGAKNDWKELYSFKADAGQLVSVSYKSASMNCTVNCTLIDPVPSFNLSVNQSSKSIVVTVEPGREVYARWCYLKNSWDCTAKESYPITIDPSKSQSGLLKIPHLLPCVCVQVYYTYVDAKRQRKCPFQNENLADVKDVWLSSRLTPYKSYLKWSSQCPASDLQISASLCWRQHEHLCTPVHNLTRQETPDGNVKYNTTAVDKHPQMCVQLSFHGYHNISCPFISAESVWEVRLEPRWRSVYLYLSYSIEATYSAQLCILHERGCSPLGQERNSTGKQIHVPLQFLPEKPCVQVWQSDPALQGRKIFCLDYTHNRWGLYAVAALIVVCIFALLGVFICHLTKRGAAGWLSIQKPLLLVCSSEHSAHVSAVCALASILQGDLSAPVHMALWAQSSHTQAGTGVADLGPLPWLYGQWETMRKAQGKVLIIWSPEAKKSYETWRKERADTGMKEETIKDIEESLKLNAKRLGKCRFKKAIREKDCVSIHDECHSQKEPSTVITPVFKAALACLEGELQGSKGQGVALVYFHGFCRSRDIPKALRGIPMYCLPQDFRGLIQELGVIRRQTKTNKFQWHCWPRLLSKVLSVWLARQLAQRLQKLLPQTHGKKIQGSSVTASLKHNSDKTQSGLKLPLTANKARLGTEQEHEPLHLSPWRAETL